MTSAHVLLAVAAAAFLFAAFSFGVAYGIWKSR